VLRANRRYVVDPISSLSLINVASASQDGGFFKEEYSVLSQEKIMPSLKTLHSKYNAF